MKRFTGDFSWWDVLILGAVLVALMLALGCRGSVGHGAANGAAVSAPAEPPAPAEEAPIPGLPKPPPQTAESKGGDRAVVVGVWVAGALALASAIAAVILRTAVLGIVSGVLLLIGGIFLTYLRLSLWYAYLLFGIVGVAGLVSLVAYCWWLVRKVRLLERAARAIVVGVNDAKAALPSAQADILRKRLFEAQRAGHVQDFLDKFRLDKGLK